MSDTFKPMSEREVKELLGECKKFSGPPYATLDRALCTIEYERELLVRYKRGLENHLCDYDLSDWLACAGGHTVKEGERVYCSVCSGEGDHFHQLQHERKRSEKMRAALETGIALEHV